jgi:hypothetical protein
MVYTPTTGQHGLRHPSYTSATVPPSAFQSWLRNDAQSQAEEGDFEGLEHPHSESAGRWNRDGARNVYEGTASETGESCEEVQGEKRRANAIIGYVDGSEVEFTDNSEIKQTQSVRYSSPPHLGIVDDGLGR